MSKWILIIFLSFALNSFGQETDTSRVSYNKNTIYGELGGNAGTYSLNFDHVFHDKEIWKISYSVGITNLYFKKRYDRPVLYGMPIAINFFSGRTNNFVEFGLGLSAFYSAINNYDQLDRFDQRYKDLILLGNSRIGYRYQRSSGGIFFRLGLLFMSSKEIPLNYSKEAFLDENTNGFRVQPWIGLSLG